MQLEVQLEFLDLGSKVEGLGSSGGMFIWRLT